MKRFYLRNLKYAPSKPGIINTLSAVFNAPVLTESESKVLLNEINESFRKALNESRHPNDVRPPPTIDHAIANKVDNHIQQILTSPIRPSSPANAGNLRNLLSAEALLSNSNPARSQGDESPIAIFKEYLTHGTADAEFAARCCERYVRLELARKGSGGYPHGGLAMYRMTTGQKEFQEEAAKGLRKKPFRFWLTGALMLDNTPNVLLERMLTCLETHNFRAFRLLLTEFVYWYGKIHNTPQAPYEDVKVFIHLLSYDKRSYQLFGKHPKSEVISQMDTNFLQALSLHMKQVAPGQEALTASLAQKLYLRRFNHPEAREMLAKAVELWDRPPSPFGAEVLIENGHLTKGAQYLINMGDPPLESQDQRDTLSSTMVVGLLAATSLKTLELGGNLVDKVMGVVEKSFGILEKALGSSETVTKAVLPTAEKVWGRWNAASEHKQDWKTTENYLVEEVRAMEVKLEAGRVSSKLASSIS